ncbi:MAG: energy transducer TonB [Erythrobacter sp.]
MSYVNTTNRTNPVAVLGALGVPGAFGVLLVLGLAIKVVTPPIDDDLAGYQYTAVEIDPIVEPEVTAEVEPTTQSVTPDPTVLPPPPRPDTGFEFSESASTPISTLPTLGDDFGIGSEPVDFGAVIPAGPPAIDPIAASPRGNASGWITNDDYRTSWINRDYSGVAAFSLSIDARGRVTNCSITNSTGHDVLDRATCRLLQRRARFNPALDSAGEPVAGTFASSVNWQIPE